MDPPQTSDVKTVDVLNETVPSSGEAATSAKGRYYKRPTAVCIVFHPVHVTQTDYKACRIYHKVFYTWQNTDFQRILALVFPVLHDVCK